ncbi:hypothetical protein CORAM0001_1971 [Corynebacterium amycolatum SK46]|nr:hypothetical protein CORAM0001_1971 [Corynebacterium amycolatum SK46]
MSSSFLLLLWEVKQCIRESASGQWVRGNDGVTHDELF